jgi:hypothetical protein
MSLVQNMANDSLVLVTCPAGCYSGDAIELDVDYGRFNAIIPPKVVPGGVFYVRLPKLASSFFPDIEEIDLMLESPSTPGVEALTPMLACSTQPGVEAANPMLSSSTQPLVEAIDPMLASPNQPGIEAVDDSLDGPILHVPTSTFRGSIILTEGERVDAAVVAAGAARASCVNEGQWCDASDSHQFLTRSKTYMASKVKAAPGPVLAKCIALMVLRDGKDGTLIHHAASRGKCGALVREVSQLTAAHRAPGEPCCLVVNLQVPGVKFAVHLVQIFALPVSLLGANGSATSGAFLAMFRRFYEDLPIISENVEHFPAQRFQDDDFRNQRFKLIPRLSSGPWILRNAVPTRPALIGTKVQHRYFRGESYVEIDVDVGSLALAHKLASMSRGASSMIRMDMGYVLEGREETELPEQVQPIMLL